jgi:hypothetical protein
LQTSASLWLEQSRIWVQCGWFALFGVALLLSILAFYRPGSSGLTATARSFWAMAMFGFVLIWMAGTVVEMMRRAAKISGVELVLALAAFSVLLAGTVSLVREWFGPRWGDPIKSERLALSLGVLTLAGWWFGGMGLQWNALWNFAPQDYGRVRAPDGWALALGGAALLGASRLVRSPDEEVVRVRNPRAAMWWIGLTALFLVLPVGGNNAGAASVFLFGAGVFAIKIWRSRGDCPLVFRVNPPTRVVMVALVALLPLLYPAQSATVWLARLILLWSSPFYLFAFSGLCLAIAWVSFKVREPLRLAIFDSFSSRALLHGTLAGILAATLLYGPAGAIFWAFWPLAGLFFDLLAPRDISTYSRHSELPAEVATANASAAGSADPFSG